MKFKVGDRVAVYHGASWGGNRYTIANITLNGLIECHTIGSNNVGILTFHPKQCRKLVRKQQRRIWVREAHLDQMISSGSPNASFGISQLRTTADDVEFIEVLPKKENK